MKGVRLYRGLGIRDTRIAFCLEAKLQPPPQTKAGTSQTLVVLRVLG